VINSGMCFLNKYKPRRLSEAWAPLEVEMATPWLSRHAHGRKACGRAARWAVEQTCFEEERFSAAKMPKARGFKGILGP
jgi:hypothetical protein